VCAHDDQIHIRFFGIFDNLLMIQTLFGDTFGLYAFTLLNVAGRVDVLFLEGLVNFFPHNRFRRGMEDMKLTLMLLGKITGIVEGDIRRFGKIGTKENPIVFSHFLPPLY
jgi:hypothetical protein